jgi:hypothetical protein
MENFEIENNKVKRVETQVDLNTRYAGEVNLNILKNVGEKLFRELKNDYGILSTVEFRLVKDEKGLDVINILNDWVDGKNLKEVEKTPEVIEQIENLYSIIAKYLFDKLLVGGFFLADINSATQYVYGRKEENDIQQIYLVDTDLYIGYGKTSLYHTVKWFVRHMIEDECGKKFDKARKYIEKFIYGSLPENVNEDERVMIEKNILEAKAFFEGRGKTWKDSDDIGFNTDGVLDALNKI